ncbi:hypothetical protein ACLJYM_18255 [Rhizobium giardinii]|uniref:hypothetical protein n=1 Tax=Rhizobium giardinii TaxID=56731 RepID=UPI0039E1BD23
MNHFGALRINHKQQHHASGDLSKTIIFNKQLKTQNTFCKKYSSGTAALHRRLGEEPCRKAGSLIALKNDRRLAGNTIFSDGRFAVVSAACQ